MDRESVSPSINDPQVLGKNLLEAVARRQENALQHALPALNANPSDPAVLLLTIMAALLDQKPQHALRYLQRFTKNWQPYYAEAELLRSIAMAQQGIWPQAAHILRANSAIMLSRSIYVLPAGEDLAEWFQDWIKKIERHSRQQQTALAAKKAAAKRSSGDQSSVRAEKAAAR